LSNFIAILIVVGVSYFTWTRRVAGDRGECTC